MADITTIPAPVPTPPTPPSVTPPAPTKQPSDLSFGERAKFTLRKYSLINGQKMDPVAAETQVRAEFGLVPLGDTEKQKLAGPGTLTKIIASKPAQVLGVTALWNQYIEGKPVIAQPPVGERVKAYAKEETGTAKDHAIGFVQHAAQSVVTKLAHEVGLDTQPIVTTTPHPTAAPVATTPTAAEVVTPPTPVAIPTVEPTTLAAAMPAPTPVTTAIPTEPTVLSTPAAMPVATQPTDFFNQPTPPSSAPIDVAAAQTEVFTRVPEETANAVK